MKKTFALFLLGSLLFAAGIANATASVSYDAAETSDSLRLRGVTLGVENGYLLKAESQQLEMRSQTERIHTVSAGYRFKKEKHEFEGLYKLIDLDREDSHRTRGLGSLGYTFTEEKVFTRLTLRQHLPAQTLSILQPSSIDLKEEELTANLVFTPLKKLKLQTTQILGWRSDANRKHNSDYALLYGVSPGWPWIWVGYGYYTLKYSERSPGYWSPQDFSSHGFRIDSSFPIYSKLSGIFGLNLNNYDEDGFSGKGHYGVAGLQWGSSAETHFKATWTQIRSGQSSSPWKYDGLMLSFFTADF